VLEDDRSLDVGHLRLGGEGTHGDIAQVVGITNDDVDEKVIGTGHVVERNYLGQVLGILTESGYLRGLMPMEPDRNHCLKPHAQNRWVDISVEPTEHSGVLETADSLGACRLGYPNPTRYLLVGQARIVLEEGHDGAICSVKSRNLSHCPNTFHILLTLSAENIVSVPDSRRKRC
jgi:hypothetical protein